MNNNAQPYNPFEDIKSFNDLLDRLDLLLTTLYDADFRIGYKVRDIPLYRPVVNTIRKVFDPLRGRGSYQFFIASRYLRWTDGHYEPVRRTLIMEYRSETIFAPPERERRRDGGWVVPHPSMSVCQACGGIGGTERAEQERSGLPFEVWALHFDLYLPLEAAVSSSKNQAGAASSSATTIQAARDLGVTLERGVLQVLTGETVFGFESTSKTKIAAVGILRSWMIPIGDPPDDSELQSLRPEPGWRVPCGSCYGTGTR